MKNFYKITFLLFALFVQTCGALEIAYIGLNESESIGCGVAFVETLEEKNPHTHHLCNTEEITWTWSKEANLLGKETLVELDVTKIRTVEMPESTFNYFVNNVRVKWNSLSLLFAKNQNEQAFMLIQGATKNNSWEAFENFFKEKVLDVLTSDLQVKLEKLQSQEGQDGNIITLRDQLTKLAY